MKKNYIIVGAIFFALVLSPSIAIPWGLATHAYIDDNLGKKWGLMNSDEIYGGMATDIFNLMFDKPQYLTYFYGQTHYEFFKLWHQARTIREKALAYGFVSHNDLWGADYTAHHECITCSEDKGYVIAKAMILKGILEEVQEYQALNLPYEVAIEVAHNIVEAGLDILIKRINPMIGHKMIVSASLRSSEFPLLLVKAYARDFSKYANISYLQAVNIIISSEMEFRKRTILYGQVLTQNEATTIQLISEQMADLSEAFLAAYEIILPTDTDLKRLVKLGLEHAIQICEADFEYEIRETIKFVDMQLKAQGITY